MDNYTLEYSEKQGFFHYADNDITMKNGYTIICKNLSYKQCNEFTQLIFEKYPIVNTDEQDKVPFDVIFNEFVQFLYS
jgi:hypothetical protein